MHGKRYVLTNEERNTNADLKPSAYKSACLATQCLSPPGTTLAKTLEICMTNIPTMPKMTATLRVN